MNSLSLAALLVVSGSGVAGAEHPAGQHILDLVAPHEIYRIDADNVDGGDFMPGAVCTERTPGATGKVMFKCDIPFGGIDLKGKIQLLPSNKIDGATGTSRIAVKGRFSGSIKTGGQRVEYTYTLSGRANVDPMFGTADVPLKLKQCAEVQGERFCQKMSFGSENVPMTSATGTWTVDLDVTDLGGRKLGGTATATFPGLTPTTLDYLIDGRYDPNEDTAQLELIPQNRTKGNSMRLKNLRVSSGQVSGGKLIYDVWGHEGKAGLTPAP